MRRGGAGHMGSMTEPEQTPDVEQRIAQEVEPDRHRAPSEGLPQDLGEDEDDAGGPMPV